MWPLKKKASIKSEIRWIEEEKEACIKAISMVYSSLAIDPKGEETEMSFGLYFMPTNDFPEKLKKEYEIYKEHSVLEITKLLENYHSILEKYEKELVVQ